MRRFVPLLACLVLVGCFSSTTEPGIDPAASYQLTLVDARLLGDRPTFSGIDESAAEGHELRVDFLVDGERIDARVSAPWEAPVRYRGTVGDGTIAFEAIEGGAMLQGTAAGGWTATVTIERFEIDGELVDGQLVWEGTGRFEAYESFFAGDVGDSARSEGAIDARVDDVPPEARVSAGGGGFGGNLMPWQSFHVRLREPVDAAMLTDRILASGAVTVELDEVEDGLVTSLVVTPEGWWAPGDVEVAVEQGLEDLEGNVAFGATSTLPRIREPEVASAIDLAAGDRVRWGSEDALPSELACDGCERFYLEHANGGFFARVDVPAAFTTVRARVRVVTLEDEWGGGGWAQPINVTLAASPAGEPTLERVDDSLASEEPLPEDSPFVGDTGWVDLELPLESARTDVGIVFEARAFGYGGGSYGGGGPPLPPSRAWVLVESITLE